MEMLHAPEKPRGNKTVSARNPRPMKEEAYLRPRIHTSYYLCPQPAADRLPALRCCPLTHSLVPAAGGGVRQQRRQHVPQAGGHARQVGQGGEGLVVAGARGPERVQPHLRRCLHNR